MAKYLRTSGISSNIDELIRDAKEKLYIISPYLKLSDHIRELLNDKEREKVDVRMIFGKQELSPFELNYLQGLKYVRLYFSKNLHAKCYLNENKMIITSMNLYEFSQQNNREMGILIDKLSENDKQIYDDAWKDIESILHNAQDFAYIQSPQKSKEEVKNEPQQKTFANNAFCIRTGAKIPFNLEKPFTPESYKSWNKFGDPNYKEKYCHYSGELSNGETSFSKPILNKYWKKARETFGF